MVLCHVSLDRALARGRVAADGAAPGTSSNVSFQMTLEVALHRCLVRALRTREHLSSRQCIYVRW